MMRAASRGGRHLVVGARRAGVAWALAAACVAAPAAAQRAGEPPVGGVPPAADSLAALPDSLRRLRLITGDADPAGAIIELRQRLKLSDAQVASLRQLRHAQQRLVRTVRDSLDALNVPVGVVPVAGVAPPGRDGREGRGGRGAPGGRSLTEAQRDVVRALTDTVRTVTRATRDEALAVLTPAQRDTLDAMERQLADSMAVRRGRPR